MAVPLAGLVNKFSLVNGITSARASMIIIAIRIVISVFWFELFFEGISLLKFVHYLKLRVISVFDKKFKGWIGNK